MTAREYFNFGRPTVQVTPLLVSKVNTVLQTGVLLSALTVPALGLVVSPWVMKALWWEGAVGCVYSCRARPRTHSCLALCPG